MKVKKIIIILVILISINTIFADSNGIWHFAKDIRGGIFGSDEGTQSFTFNDSLYTNMIKEYQNLGIQFKTSNDNLSLFISNDGNVGIGKEPTAKLDVNGNIKMNNELVATQNWVNLAISNFNDSLMISGSDSTSTYVADIYDKTLTLTSDKTCVCGSKRVCDLQRAPANTEFLIRTYNNLEEYLGDNLEIISECEIYGKWSSTCKGIAKLYDSDGNLINSYSSADIVVPTWGSTKTDSLEIPKSDLNKAGKNGKLEIKGYIRLGHSEYSTAYITPTLRYKPIVGIIVN